MMYNTGRKVVFVRVLGVGVKGAFLKGCEATFLRFPTHVVHNFGRGVGMGLRDAVAKHILTQLIIEGALGCTTRADWWYLLGSWVKV